ncbi:MAG TPA: hypothetical protein VL633_13465 [Bacteroidota bacterium]|nr:hypothetical protein [Bacteroidota bacterium]
MIGSAKSRAVRETTVTEYDLRYKKGWNRIVNEVISVDGYVTSHKRTVRNVNAGSWFLDY